MTPVHLGRINYAGDLGYELWVAPEYQRELKAQVVREQLTRLGGVTVDVTVAPLSMADLSTEDLGWRTRVQYTVDSSGRAGLRKHRSHEVVPIDECLIAHPRVRSAPPSPCTAASGRSA